MVLSRKETEARRHFPFYSRKKMPKGPFLCSNSIILWSPTRLLVDCMGLPQYTHPRVTAWMALLTAQASLRVG